MLLIDIGEGFEYKVLKALLESVLKVVIGDPKLSILVHLSVHKLQDILLHHFAQVANTILPFLK